MPEETLENETYIFATDVSSGLKVIKNKPAGVIPDLSEVVCVAYVYVA